MTDWAESKIKKAVRNKKMQYLFIETKTIAENNASIDSDSDMNIDEVLFYLGVGRKTLRALFLATFEDRSIPDEVLDALFAVYVYYFVNKWNQLNQTH